MNILSTRNTDFSLTSLSLFIYQYIVYYIFFYFCPLLCKWQPYDSEIFLSISARQEFNGEWIHVYCMQDRWIFGTLQLSSFKTYKKSSPRDPKHFVVGPGHLLASFLLKYIYLIV